MEALAEWGRERGRLWERLGCAKAFRAWVSSLSIVFPCSHDFIGEFTTSYRELARGQSQFNIYEVRCTRWSLFP